MVRDAAPGCLLQWPSADGEIATVPSQDNAARVVFQHKPITGIKMEKCHTKEKINSSAQQQIDLFFFIYFVEPAASGSPRAVPKRKPHCWKSSASAKIQRG